MGRIVTEELDLTYMDHVLTGRVGDRPVYARPLADEFGVRLYHRAGGTDYESVFKSGIDGFVGEVITTSPAGVQMNEVFRIESYSAEDGTLSGTVGPKAFFVQVSSETMNGHHYVSPHFELTVDGAAYTFDLIGTQACMGCIMKLSYTIIAMLYGYGAI